MLDALEAGGHSLGGEQSGHVIFPDSATTGDGLLTGVQLLDVVARAATPLGELAGGDDAVPAGAAQRAHRRWRQRRRARRAARRTICRPTRQRLGDDGRVLVRRSGTEPLVRVMVEAPTAEQAEAVADRLAAAVTAAAS